MKINKALEIFKGRKLWRAEKTAIKAMEALVAIDDFFAENIDRCKVGIRHEDAVTYSNIIKLFIEQVENEEEE